MSGGDPNNIDKNGGATNVDKKVLAA